MANREGRRVDKFDSGRPKSASLMARISAPTVVLVQGGFGDGAGWEGVSRQHVLAATIDKIYAASLSGLGKLQRDRC